MLVRDLGPHIGDERFSWAHSQSVQWTVLHDFAWFKMFVQPQRLGNPICCDDELRGNRYFFQGFRA